MLMVGTGKLFTGLPSVRRGEFDDAWLLSAATDPGTRSRPSVSTVPAMYVCTTSLIKAHAQGTCQQGGRFLRIDASRGIINGLLYCMWIALPFLLAAQPVSLPGTDSTTHVIQALNITYCQLAVAAGHQILWSDRGRPEPERQPASARTASLQPLISTPYGVGSTPSTALASSLLRSSSSPPHCDVGNESNTLCST